MKDPAKRTKPKRAAKFVGRVLPRKSWAPDHIDVDRCTPDELIAFYVRHLDRHLTSRGFKIYLDRIVRREKRHAPDPDTEPGEAIAEQAIGYFAMAREAFSNGDFERAAKFCLYAGVHCGKASVIFDNEVSGRLSKTSTAGSNAAAIAAIVAEGRSIFESEAKTRPLRKEIACEVVSRMKARGEKPPATATIEKYLKGAGFKNWSWSPKWRPILGR